LAKSRIKDRRRVADFWTRKARAENFPARSVYKLKEVDDKYGLLKPGRRVLDLGASPGSWTLYAAERVGPAGRVVGLDLQPLAREPGPGTVFVQADALDPPLDLLTGYGPFDVVLSDLAPATTGQKSVDQVRSAGLARGALTLAGALLKPGGWFLVKVFQGPEADDFFKELAGRFKTVRRIKPASSRSFSPEIFGLGLGFKG